jgi:hypothetical protein
VPFISYGEYLEKYKKWQDASNRKRWQRLNFWEYFFHKERCVQCGEKLEEHIIETGKTSGKALNWCPRCRQGYWTQVNFNRRDEIVPPPPPPPRRTPFPELDSPVSDELLRLTKKVHKNKIGEEER